VNVLDASAQVNLLVGEISDSDRARFDEELAAPDVFLVEVASGLRRLVLRGLLSADRAGTMVAELVHAPVELVPSRELVERAFEMRGAIAVADACYVALAEARECALVTSDRRLARTPGLAVPVIVV